MLWSCTRKCKRSIHTQNAVLQRVNTQPQRPFELRIGKCSAHACHIPLPEMSHTQLVSPVPPDPPVLYCRSSVTQRCLKTTLWDFCTDVVYLRQNYSRNISRLGRMDYRSQFLVPMNSFNTDLSAVPKAVHTSLLLWNRSKRVHFVL